MRVVVVAFFALLAVAKGLENVKEDVLPLFNYHDEIGIPLAEKIRVAEEALLNESEDNEEVRIVGGSFAQANTYPYLGGLLLSMTHTTARSICGSTLISLNRAITAAHCWFDGVRQAWQVEVVLGAQFLYIGGTRVISSQVVVHPQWTPSTFANDVAIIYFPTNVVFSQTVQPVQLPFGNLLSQNFAGWWSRAAGYGRLGDNVNVDTSAQISHVNLQVITQAQCAATFGTTYVTASTICTSGAGGVGVCQGDSGGPLVVTQNGQDILVGVSSFVAGTGCQLGHPSGYARVTSFYNFILQNMW